MSDLLLQLSGNPNARKVIKSLGLPIPMPQKLRRAKGAWAERPLDDYTLTNASVTYAVSDSADAYLRVENLFDEEYQTVRGYGQPGRSIFAGLRARF